MDRYDALIKYSGSALKIIQIGQSGSDAAKTAVERLRSLHHVSLAIRPLELPPSIHQSKVTRLQLENVEH